MNTAFKYQFAEGSLDKRDFERLSKFIYDYSGIRMPATKMNMLEGRLRRRLSALGMDDFHAYCEFFFDEGGMEQEAVHLIDAVSTNKTDFFRESNHFDFLYDNALPALHAQGVKTVRAWSSASSTGEEPYSMAMVMDDFCRTKPGMDFDILATDINFDVLDTALSGIYHKSRIDPLPSEYKTKYVMQSKMPKSEEVRIVPDLRAKIGFARFNLMEPSYRVGEPLHIIFCRNVLIYFDKKTQEHVLRQLLSCLVPGGYLLIGHSETASGFSLPVKQVASTVFQKI